MATHAVHVHPGNDLIAVFRTRAEASDAGHALVGAGADPEEVVLAEAGDRDVVLRAEMQTEFGRGPLSWQSLTTRHGRLPSVLAMGAIGWAASAVIAAVVAMFDFGPDPYWERFAIVFAVVVAMGTMVSLLAIGAIATGSTDPRLASEVGTTLHVHHASDTSCAMLLQMPTMRVDEVTGDGRPAPGVHTLNGRSISPTGRHNVGWG